MAEAADSGGSATVTETGTVEPEQRSLTLKLRKRKPDKKVEWSSDTVDNEHLGRRSSKCCCIYERPRAFGESSSESSGEEEEGEGEGEGGGGEEGSGGDEGEPGGGPGGSRGGSGGCGHHHCIRGHKRGRGRQTLPHPHPGPLPPTPPTAMEH